MKIGDIFGLREVIEINRSKIKVKCSCGAEDIVRKDRLLRGESKSCMSCRFKIHDDTKTRLHNIWIKMNYRCTHSEEYPTYTNINVCEEWKNSYLIFKKWAIENNYKDNLTIDRINTYKNYEPDNCRWADRNVQAQNTKKRKSKTNETGIRVSGKKFYARITHKNVEKYLGTFDTVEEAKEARSEYINRHNTAHRTYTL